MVVPEEVEVVWRLTEEAVESKYDTEDHPEEMDAGTEPEVVPVAGE